jgi:hypothetical protein
MTLWHWRPKFIARDSTLGKFSYPVFFLQPTVPGEISFIVSAKTGMIVYHSRTVRKNFKIFNKTGKDFVLIQ